MKYRFGFVLLVIAILAACNFATEYDVSDEIEQSKGTDDPLLISTREKEETKAAASFVEATASMDASVTGMANEMNVVQAPVNKEDLPCISVSPGSPFLDQTIPDGTRVFSGEVFTKTWRLINSGSCSWNGDFAVVWFSGADLGVSHRQNFNEVVSPGQFVDISVDMRAPSIQGIYQSNWKLMTADGSLYGIGPTGDSPFWVMIEVVERVAPTPQPTFTSTPTPVVLIEGVISMHLGDVLNVDTGTIQQPGEDFIFEINPAQQYVFLPMNGARLGLFGAEAPTFSDCMNSQMETEFLEVVTTSPGNLYYCFRTSQGLPGRLRIVSADLAQNNILAEFLTWSIP